MRRSGEVGLVADATQTFFAGLIDDAGLFPPARLPALEALEAHERAAASNEFWIAGRFVLPASRAAEILAAVDESPAALPISVVLDGATPLDALPALAALPVDRLDVWSLEVPLAKLPGDTDDERLARLAQAVHEARFPDPISVYVEIALHPDQAERGLTALARARRSADDSLDLTLYAKVRCGGLVAEAVPNSKDLARFIWTASRLGVPFKATAGLHHPNRRDDPSVGARMHGFLNVIGGAILTNVRGLDLEGLAELIDDDEPGDFTLDRRHFAWRGIGVDAAEIEAARAGFVHGFGCCSFEEPIEDLTALGILRAGSHAPTR